MLETHATFAGTKTRGMQAQRSTIWPSDRVEIKEVYTNYLPLERFLRKQNSRCAAPGFRPPLVMANPGAPNRYFGPQKMGSQTVNRAVLSRLYAEGVIWVPRSDPAKKKRNFLGIFSLFSAFFFFFQKTPPPCFCIQRGIY